MAFIRDNSTMRRGRSIAFDLALLMAIVVFPLALLAAYLVSELAQRQLDHAAGVVREISATSADRAQRYIASIRDALVAVSGRPMVRAMDPSRCDPTLPELLRLYPGIANAIVVNLDGRILCGAIPPPEDRPVYIVDKALLAEMIARPKFLLSRPLISRIGKQWTVAAIQPVFGADGKLAGTVNFAIDLTKWISFAGIRGLEGEAVVGIVTGQGVIIARSRDPEKWIGQDASDGDIHKRAMELKEGTLRTTGIAGIDRLWAFVPVGGTDWYALAGLPAERVYGPVQQGIARMSALLLAVLAAALAVAVMASSRLLRPLRAIAAVARARSEGSAGLRVPNAGPAEIADLGAELNRMIDASDRMQQSVRDSEERYRRLVDLSPDPMLIHSEYRIVMVNFAMEQLLGATDETQLVGQSATFVLAPEYAAGAEDRIRRLYTGEKLPRAEQVYRRLDGGFVEVEISSAPVSFDGKPAVHVTARDISDRKRGDESLRRFRAAMDISGDAILLIDRASLRYIDVNQTFCSMVGYAREEILGMTPMDIFSAERAVLERDYDAIIADPGAPASLIEGRYRRKDGSTFPVETRRRALHTKDGWVMVATARDITLQKEAEERIGRLNRVYAVLSGINAAIVRIRDRAELFGEACRIAVEAGQFQLAWIGVVDAAARQLRPVAWRGPEGTMQRFREAVFSLDAGEGDDGRIVADALRTKRAVLVNDAQADARIRRPELLGALGIRSVALLPLTVGEEARGLLALHSAQAGYFDEEEVRLLLELAGDISFALDHIEKSERVDYLAYYDELTGLANRRLFTERLAQYLHAAGQDGEKIALAVVDVERLRVIDESLGRQAADALLKAVAGRLAAGGDRTELARISAELFAVVMQGVKGKSAVTRRIERLWQQCFGAAYDIGGQSLRIAARAGVALFPADGVDAETLVRNAEAALRRAKETGERHVFHAHEMTEGTAEKLTLENRLRQALERDEFVLHYQPKVDIDSRRIVGVEALIRWQNPDLGLVPPGRFIPLMEETGIILEAGAWALAQAVRDHQRWLELGCVAPRVAVNVSAVQLRKKDYLETLGRALRLGAEPPGVDLEITESLVMEDIQGNIEKLREARRLGVSIAIDDFGTGYSSLGYLAKLPVQALKIDRSFIITMLNEPDTMTLVSTIISLAHSLKLKVIAEGVESEEQAKFLRLLRCDEMQGYLFSRPVPFDGITALLPKR